MESFEQLNGLLPKDLMDLNEVLQGRNHTLALDTLEARMAFSIFLCEVFSLLWVLALLV